MPARESTILSPAVRTLYPFEGKVLDVDAGRLHYLDEGAGDPLLMVHGNPTWSFYYRDLVLALRDRYRCVVPDHLGCGLSDKPSDWGYTINDHVDNLVRLIDELDLRRATLVVHDWGGVIGYLAALRRPGRFARFVVFNSGVFLLPLPRALTVFRLPLYGPIVIRGLNAFLHAGLRYAVVHKERFRGAVREGYLAPYDTWAHRVAVLRFVQEIPIEPHHPNRQLLPELDRQLPSLAGFPHLIVWGRKDWVFHEGYLQGWRERFPNAEVHVLEDASHWVVEEASDRVIPMVEEFLNRHPIAVGEA
jgi:pimeloyl-ACP methyl ester carboxylesterase